MARALGDILSELNAVYNPQRDVYNKQIEALPGQEQAEAGGLEAAKNDSFNEITTGANRRGLFFSGIPLQEQASYLGKSYLPAVANLKNRFAQQRFNLQDALAQITQKQYAQAYELQAEEQAREAAERAARAGGGGGGGGGFDLGSLLGGGGGGGQQRPAGQPQLSLRQTLQQRAKAGDWNAQVGLNYLGDNGRYDGPVNSKAEYDILKAMGAGGNFYVRQSANKAPNSAQVRQQQTVQRSPLLQSLGRR